MCNDNDCQYSLETLKEQLEAWRAHVLSLELHDRRRFIEWLAEVLTVREFALLIDGEILRNTLWEIYLREHYGP